MGVKKARIRQFSLKVEGTEGTAETLAAADVPFEVEDLDAGFINEKNQRVPLRSSLSKLKRVSGRTMGDITGRVELVGGGGLTTAPPVKPLLLACGMREKTVKKVAVTSVVGTFIPGERVTDGGTKVARFVNITGSDMSYAEMSGSAFVSTDTLTGDLSGATCTVNATPSASGFAYFVDSTENVGSYTARANFDGLAMQIHGARGSLAFEIEAAGALAYARFALNGTAVAPTDQALFTGVTLPTVIPEAFLSANVQVDSVATCIDSLTMDLQNEVVERRCANAATGIQSYRINDRDPIITIDPEAQLEADQAFWSKYNNDTEMPFHAQIGSTATRRITLAAPAAEYRSLDTEEREGLDIYNATLGLLGDQADDTDDEIMVASW